MAAYKPSSILAWPTGKHIFVIKNLKPQKEPSDFHIWLMVNRFSLGILQLLIHRTVSFSMYGRGLEFYLRGTLLWNFRYLPFLISSLTIISLSEFSLCLVSTMAELFFVMGEKTPYMNCKLIQVFAGPSNAASYRKVLSFAPWIGRVNILLISSYQRSDNFCFCYFHSWLDLAVQDFLSY